VTERDPFAMFREDYTPPPPKPTEGDVGTWSHCGRQEPHAPHLHTVVFNEGPYPDVQCNGTPGPDPVHVEPVNDPLTPVGRAWQRFYRPGMGTREAEAFKAGFAAALGLAADELERATDRAVRQSGATEPVHLPAGPPVGRAADPVDDRMRHPVPLGRRGEGEDQRFDQGGGRDVPRLPGEVAMTVLAPVNGPRAGTTRRVRHDGSTMADLRLPDGTWVLYDGRGLGRVDVVHWREAGPEREGAFPVVEIHRYAYEGVL